MAKELLKRVQLSTTLNAPTTAGVLPQDEYPTKPHQVLVHSSTQTDLTAIHEFLSTDVDTLSVGDETREAWVKELKSLQARYFFTASTTNKWSTYTFDRWQSDVTTVVLMHVVAQYSKIESSAEGSGTRKLFEPSTAKDTSKDAARSAASKFCPELLYDHGLQINNSTIEKDLDEYAKLIHPTQYSNSLIGTDRQKTAAASAISMFKDNTRSTIGRVNKIVSHEVERLLLAIMPQGKHTPTFKMLKHHRSKYIEAEYKKPDSTDRTPYNAAQSFKYLKEHCTGSNERMAALYSYVLINLERQPHQSVLDWSRSFVLPTRMAEKFRDPFVTDEEKHTYYHDPFVGQLTSNEIQKLNAGNFLITESQLFDKEKFESFVAGHSAQFPSRYIPDKRTREFILNKRKLFASAYPPKQEANDKKRKHSEGKSEHNLYTEQSSTPPPKQYKAMMKGSGPPIKGKQSDNRGHRNHALSKGGKGKSSKGPHEGLSYGGRQSTDKGRNRTPNNAHYNKGKQPHSGKGKGKRTSTSSNQRSWCTFCRKPGHTRSNCFQVQKLQRTKPYKNILLELEGSQQELLQTAIDSHGSDYCTVCHDPSCSAKHDSLDPMAGCINGPSDEQTAVQNILYLDEHSPLIHEIEKLKPSEEHDVHMYSEGTSLETTSNEECYATNTEYWREHQQSHYNPHESQYSHGNWDYNHGGGCIGQEWRE